MPTSSAPIVSVLLPVYNGERHLQLALDSILHQTFTDFEFLILDDGSRDGSLSLLEQAARADSRVKLFSRENRGLVATLNELIERAQGRYLARMDADDIAQPNRFALQVAFLDAHPGVVCVGGAQALIDEEGRYLTNINGPLANQAIQQSILAGHGAICHPTAMIRASALAEVGGYDPAMWHCEDLDLWLRLGECGQLANLADVVLKYRLDPGSVSSRHWREQRENAKKACEAAWKRRGIVGHFEAGDPWRPDGTKAGNSNFYLKYGWWAFSSGERRTALHYALRAAKEMPTNLEAYKLVACALLKTPSAARPGPAEL